MKIHHLLYIVCLFFIAHAARAQDTAHTYLGVIGNYEYGSPTVMNRELGVIETYGTDGNGISWDNGYGAGVYLQLPDLFSSSLGLSLLGQYTFGSGQFKSPYFSDSNSVRDFHIISNYSKAQLQALVTVAISSKFYVASGLLANFRVSNSIVQQRNIISPQGMVFRNGLTTDTIASGEAISTTKFHYGVPFVIGGRFPLSRALYLNTELFAQCDLEEALRGFIKPSLAVGFRVGVSFATDLSTTKEEATPDAPILLSAVTFATNGKAVKSVTAQRIDTTFRYYIMLPSVVSFEEQNAALPSILRSVSSNKTFDIGSYELNNVNAVYTNLLNIITKRMQDDLSSRIRITSEFRISETEALGFQRADNIAVSLMGGAKVDGSRMARDVIRGNTSRITLQDNSKILSPFITELTEQSLAVPPLAISRFISSQVGVKSWSVSVNDGSQMIATFSSEDSSAQSEMIRTIPLKKGETSDKTLIATMRVVDRSSQVRETSDTLLVNILPQESTSLGGVIETFVLLGDTSQNSTAWLAPLREKITQVINKQSIIIFQPLSEHTVESIHTIAGKFLTTLNLTKESAKKIEIITTPYSSSLPMINTEQLQHGFVVKVINAK